MAQQQLRKPIKQPAVKVSIIKLNQNKKIQGCGIIKWLDRSDN